MRTTSTHLQSGTEILSDAPIDNNYDKVIRGSLAQVITEMFLASTFIAAAAIIPAIFLRRRPVSNQTEEELQQKRELGRLL